MDGDEGAGGKGDDGALNAKNAQSGDVGGFGASEAETTREETETKSEDEDNAPDAPRRPSLVMITPVAQTFQLIGDAIGSMHDVGEGMMTGVTGRMEQISEVAEGLGTKMMAGIDKMKSDVSGQTFLHAQTDHESFKQFLTQVMKANVDSDEGSGAEMLRTSMASKKSKRRTTFASALSGRLRSKIKIKLCSRTRKRCIWICGQVVSTWFFALISWSFLLLHSIGLLLVADQTTATPDVWLGLAWGYFVFCVLELFMRSVAHKGNIWRNRWFIFDLLLLHFAVLEALLPLLVPHGVGQGQFIVLSLRWLHCVRCLRLVPRESRATMAAFGALPLGVVMLVIGIWAFIAVIWFLVLDSGIVEPPGLPEDTPGGQGGPRRGLQGGPPPEPVVIEIPQYDSYGSSLLSQLYLACDGMNWHNIIDQISGHFWSTEATRISFVMVLILVGLVTTNAMIVLVYELARQAIAHYELQNQAAVVRKQLIGLHHLEQKFWEVSSDADEGDELSVIDRSLLEKVLPHCQEELAEQHVTAEEVLQLFDHLEETNNRTVMFYDLLFGILLLTSPAGLADFLRVDHLQKQCIQITDAGNAELRNLLRSGKEALKTIEESILNLRDQLSKLRVHAQKASQEVRVIMTDVEKQFEDCAASVDFIATLRRMQLQKAHQKARQDLQSRLEQATLGEQSGAKHGPEGTPCKSDAVVKLQTLWRKAAALKLDDFDRLGHAFGYPSLREKSSWEKIQVIDTLLSAKELRSKSIPEHERQFQLAAALLRTEVKERFQKKLYKYLAGEVEDEVSVTTL
ncbi:unnamed protein product [Durusdinium trenchii]|uniref:Ion transport domain-containing protein n=1 Tax=Durusdinium trenchii TaxID=1381693 RepID=A0ABP0QEB8_9DINO